MMATEKKKRGRPPNEDKPVQAASTIRIEADLYEQFRRACYWERTTMTSCYEEWVSKFVENMQAKHNEGKPLKPIPE